MIMHTSVVRSENFVSLSIHISIFHKTKQTKKKNLQNFSKNNRTIIQVIHFVISSNAASHSLLFPSTTTHICYLYMADIPLLTTT